MWKWLKGAKELVYPFSCCPVICGCSCKKTQIEKYIYKKKVSLNFWPEWFFIYRKLFWPILLLTLLIIRAALAASIVGVSLILNNSAEPGLTGLVNGLGMTLAGIVR